MCTACNNRGGVGVEKGGICVLSYHGCFLDEGNIVTVRGATIESRIIRNGLFGWGETLHVTREGGGDLELSHSSLVAGLRGTPLSSTRRMCLQKKERGSFRFEGGRAGGGQDIAPAELVSCSRVSVHDGNY
jgi:hypothetical protein